MQRIRPARSWEPLDFAGDRVEVSRGDGLERSGQLIFNVPVSPLSEQGRSALLSMTFHEPLSGVQPMLRWALLFAIVAVIAGALGFYGLESTAATIARLFALVFLVLFVVALVFGRGAVGGPTV
jgi:uncharacterized membrane protein YtjA (UPF0391 family)